MALYCDIPMLRNSVKRRKMLVTWLVLIQVLNSFPFCLCLIAPFHGNLPLSTYLHSFCAASTSLDRLIYIEKLLIGDHHNEGAISEVNTTIFPVPRCSYRHYANITVAKLVSFIDLQSTLVRYYVVLNQSAFHYSKFQFTILLLALSQLYLSKCSSCAAPFVLLVNQNASLLFDWLSVAIHSLPDNFRLTIWFARTSSVIHLRPVLFGCLTYPNVYWPRSNEDFARMNIPFAQCNLNGTSLNVSVMEEVHRLANIRL